MKPFLNILENNIHDFKCILNHPNFIKKIDNVDSSTLHVIIGVQKREQHLNKVVESFKLNNVSNIKLTVVEIDTTPLFYKTFKDTNVNYIFVPVDSLKTNGNFSRAFAFNIGYLLNSKTKYYLFHDCDIVVQNNFISLLEEYIKSDIEWLQPFADKMVRLLNKNTTDQIFCNQIELTTEFKYGSHYTLPKSGAAGGSTLVRQDIFDKVGGFDSEIFHGYAPEDGLFFIKMCCLYRQINSVTGCHQCDSKHYAENPKIYVYHLHHDPTPVENQRHDLIDLTRKYYDSSYDQKMSYINYKESVFRKYMLDCI